MPRTVVPFEGEVPAGGERSFRDQVAEFFRTQHPRLLRVLVRLCGEPDLAADLTQEAFVSLMKRGSMPDTPEAWVITVALNRLRNERAKGSRRARLVAFVAEPLAGGDPPTVSQAAGTRHTQRRVRAALERLSERDAQLLVLRSEGYAYRDIAAALGIHEASLGTLLARARRAFVSAYEEPHAPR